MLFFGDFRKNVKIFHKKDVSTDNIIFRLHYRLTFFFLIACTVLVSSRQFIKDHINCISEKSIENVINTFCFFSTTFTVTRLHNNSYPIGAYIASPGVGPMLPDDEKTYHAYYQWVPFVLFGQALMFYAPHSLWKKFENGRIKAIVNQAKSSFFTSDKDVQINGLKIESEDSKKKKEKWLRNYLTLTRFQINRDWAKKLVLCEILTAINIILQIHMVDNFLQGNFLDLGQKWAADDQEVLERVFPKVTKCTFHKFGKTGTIQVQDAICVMALNIINEKIYVLLWFWFLALFFITLVGLVWRILSLILCSRSLAFNRLVWGEINPGPALKPAEIEMITTRLTFSDWLFLYYIGKNMDGLTFRRIVSGMMQSFGRPHISLMESDKSSLANESYC